jgi:hypothetical protein
MFADCCAELLVVVERIFWGVERKLVFDWPLVAQDFINCFRVAAHLRLDCTVQHGQEIIEDNRWIRGLAEADPPEIGFFAFQDLDLTVETGLDQIISEELAL